MAEEGGLVGVGEVVEFGDGVACAEGAAGGVVEGEVAAGDVEDVGRAGRWLRRRGDRPGEVRVEPDRGRIQP